MKQQITKMLLVLICALTIVTDIFGQMTTVLPNDGGTSANGRAPSVAYRRIRAHYLIKASEMAAAGYANGTTIGQIGFTYTAGGGAGSIPLIVYLQNTSDATNLKSTTWATAISGMTVVHNNAATAWPAGLTPNIAFSGGSSFTYTGGGVYVAFDLGCYTGTIVATTTLCNSTGLPTNGLSSAQLSGTCPLTASATTAASPFRPETRFGPNLVPCTGTPTPGNTIVSANPEYPFTGQCPGVAFTLSLQNFTSGSGVTYQWQSADDAGFTVNVTNLGTASTQVTSQTTDKYYHCQVTCSGNTGTSSNLLVTTQNNIYSCYCVPASTGTGFPITNVNFAGINNNNAVSNVVFQDFTGSVAAANVVTGQTYPISVTATGLSPNIFAGDVFIDWNHNGLFTDAGEEVDFATSTLTSIVYTGNITVPGGAFIGTTRMRVMHKFSTLSTPCFTGGNNLNTQDYLISITAPVACSGTPAPGNTTLLSGNNPSCSGVNFTLSLQNTTTGTGVTYQWQSADDAGFTVNLANLGTAATQVTSLTASKYYRCQVTCSGNTGTSNGLLVALNTDICSCISYCASTHTSGCASGDEMTNVTIPTTSLNNNSGCGAGQYTFYNGGGSQTGTMVTGSSYTISVTFGADVNQFFGAWIDYNNDGTFATTEFLGASAIAGAGGTGNVAFTVPGGTTVGTHRLRVVGGNDVSVVNTNACAASSSPWGETEDYCVTLVAPAACSGTPTPGNTIASENPICSGKAFTLSLQNITLGTGVTYQWQSADNAGFSVNLTNLGTASTEVTSQTSAKYYRCQVTCSGNTGTSNTLQVTMQSNPSSCYCLGTTTLAGCTYGLDIESVIVAGINNATTCGGSLPSMYSNFDYISGNVEQGLSYSITIGRSNFTTNTCYWGIWVDWNNDYDFLDANEYMSIFAIGGASSTGVQTGSGTLVVPGAALPGAHRMRIRSNFSVDPGQASVCTNYANPSEQEDYTLNVVVQCTGTPVAGSTAAFISVACPSVPFTLYLNGVAPALGLTYQWRSSADNITYTNIAGGTNSSLITSQQVATWYSCTITCSNSALSASSTPLQMNMDTYANCICASPNYSGASTGGCLGTTANDYIGNFTFAGINNTTSCGAGTAPYYQYFPSLIALVNQTVTYPVSVSAPAAGAAFQRFKVYIDFNDNASCDDAGEMVFNSGPISTSVNSASGSISIPANAPLGTHKLRVRSTNPLGTNLDQNSCSDDGYYGEVEEYQITISGPPPCSGTPAPGQTLASTPLACNSTTIAFSLQNATSGTGVTYQWESSPDNIAPYTAIGGATNSTYSGTQTSSKWYRCVVTCSGNNGISTPVQVSHSTACYCTAPPHGSDGCALGLYINNFTFAGINNTSGCFNAVPYTSPFYTYFPSATANVNLGVSYSISISTPVNAGNYFNHFAMWIDYNDNGSFDDAGESILASIADASTATNILTGNYTIPNTAPPGTHKLRIRSGNNNSQWASCAPANSGETEDYNIIIAPPANSAGSNSPVCVNADLNLTASPIGATSYNWTGPNGFTSSAQNPTITGVTPLAAGTYTCTMVIFGFTYAPTTTVTVNPLPSVSAGNDAPFCSGTADLHITSNAPTATGYSWTGPGVFTSAVPNPTIPNAPSSVNGTYTVTVTDANSCSNSASTVVGIYALPPADITPIGSTNLCTGQTTTDLQATGGTGYSWSTGETTDLITVSTGGTYTVTVTDVHNCVNTDSQVMTESAAPALPVVTPAGPVNLCSSDGGATYSTATLTVQNYSSNLLWSTSETTTSIDVNYADIFNVTYTDGNGCYSVSNAVVTNALLSSIDPTSVTSNAANNNICNGNSVTLTANGGTLGDNAVWKWYTTGCGTGAGVSTGTSDSYTVSPSSTTTYYARAEGTCNNTACSQATITVSTAPPSGTVHVTSAPGTGCNGGVGLVSVNAVSGATFYSWNGTSGALYSNNIGGPFVAGPYQTSSPSVYVQFASAPPAGASGYNICGFAGNACGQSNTVCTWVRAKVSVPGAISGSIIGCPSTSSSYSIAAVAGADSYTWSVTGGASITLGQGTQTAQVTFPAGFTSAVLSVTSNLNCGFSSAPRTMSISNTPATPGAISGPASVCPSASTSFSVAAVTGAVSYTWTCSVPGSTVTPSGNSCSILFPAVIPAGSQVCVTATSSCGNVSALRCKGIGNGTPNVPGNISGPSNGQCEQSGVSYSITPVSGATFYTWTSTAGSTIVPPNNLSGVGVNFSSSFISTVISVTAGNSCGSSAARTITVTGAPGTPAAITGLANPCSTSVQQYQTGGSGGATSYNWTVPSGTVILGGQGSGTLLVQIGSVSGNIAVTGSNTCGASGARTFPITIGCRQSQVDGTIGTTSATLYPNPTTGKTTVKFESVNAAKYAISVVDVTGRVILSDEMSAAEGTNMHELDLTSVAKGIYLVRMESAGEQTQLLKVTVE